MKLCFQCLNRDRNLCSNKLLSGMQVDLGVFVLQSCVFLTLRLQVEVRRDWDLPLQKRCFRYTRLVLFVAPLTIAG